MEIWKDIDGYEGHYQISSLSRVKSLSRPSWNGKVFFNTKERILSPRVKDNGYLFVTLCINNNKHHKYIHRLVAQTFLPNLDNLPQVNHKDCDKTNNQVDNLEWCNQNFNIRHAWDNGLMKPNGCIGVKNGRALLTESQVLEIRAKYVPRKYTIQMLCKEYGILYGTVQSIILRKTWKHLA